MKDQPPEDACARALARVWLMKRSVEAFGEPSCEMCELLRMEMIRGVLDAFMRRDVVVMRRRADTHSVWVLDKPPAT